MVFSVVTESFYLIHSSDMCMGGCMFAHVSDHSHPAPWVVVGSLPSWERLFFFSLSFIFLWWWCWRWYWCWWFLLSCIYVKSLFVAAERSQHVAWEPSLIWVGLVNFCIVSSLCFWWSLSCWCQCFLSEYKLHRLILFINFWTISLPNLFLKLVVSIYKSELGTLRWNTFW